MRRQSSKFHYSITLFCSLAEPGAYLPHRHSRPLSRDGPDCTEGTRITNHLPVHLSRLRSRDGGAGGGSRPGGAGGGVARVAGALSQPAPQCDEQWIRLGGASGSDRRQWLNEQQLPRRDRQQRRRWRRQHPRMAGEPLPTRAPALPGHSQLAAGRLCAARLRPAPNRLTNSAAGCAGGGSCKLARSPPTVPIVCCRPAS